MEKTNTDTIEWIRPIGYMLDNKKIFLYVEFSNKTYRLIQSPAYESVDEVPFYHVQAAIEKYGYTPFDKPVAFENMDELVKFANAILKSSYT